MIFLGQSPPARNGIEPRCVERSNPRADTSACGCGPRTAPKDTRGVSHPRPRSVSQPLAGFDSRVRKPRPRFPHRWRGFAFDAPEQLGSGCVRQSNLSGVLLHRHSTGFTDPAAGRDPVAGWRGSAFCTYPICARPYHFLQPRWPRRAAFETRKAKLASMLRGSLPGLRLNEAEEDWGR